MQVQVTLKVTSRKEASESFQLAFDGAETVLSLKDRIAADQLIAFPERDLLLDGQVLQDGCRLADCGVKDGASLDFVVKASEATLIQQLSDLLQTRDLTCDELGLLYCYKQGASVNQSLKVIGHNEKLMDFIKRSKPFTVQNGRVSLVREDTALKPFSLVDEITQILESTPSRGMEVPALCAKFVKKFNVSLESIAGMRPTDFLTKEKSNFVVKGRRYVSVKSGPRDKTRSAPEVSAPPVEYTTSGSSGEEAVEEADEAAAQNQQYLDLHAKICGRGFNSQVAQTLHDVVGAIEATTFLSIHHIVKGGSVGKGTAISGVADSEVVLFLNGLPPTGQSKWLPGLLKSVAGGLQERLGHQHKVEDVHISGDTICIRTKDLTTVHLQVSPVYQSYANVIQLLRSEIPAARRYYAAALAEEKLRFIEKQPSSVKVTIRLLKWWREQQQWSCAITKPSDEILELLAVYSALQTKPASQRLAVANVMSLLSRFDELRIVWPAYHYTKEDIWAPLLNQKPLVMDPTNPFINVADSQAFDARELMALAQTTHFFW
eukprot:gnl/TRDRNA2_/TRDRNA2_174830_c0_seq3.p1 gnl/TRDRNA2_/TRDRNA2_174830_c0~~gnl/TRDRNA2_/TRDRNA2_174830_c0_seq3.p1  ORF type:complete len:547 (+),score=123.11 gnl/TRDRNA2_/TRDRNA2_174830_c0_seq3:81-1721(+)